MLRRDPAKPWLRRRERPDWRLGLPGERLGGQEQGQDRPLSVESSSPPQYDGGLRTDKWEMSGKWGMSDRKVEIRHEARLCFGFRMARFALLRSR